MRYLFALLTLCMTALASFASAQDRPSTILVLDASGSMWGQIDGVNKIVIAREVVADILSDFPSDQNLGLVTYGHRQRGECTDIETLVPPATGTAGNIISIVNSLNPRGMTPMTDAVIAAAQALQYTEQSATVILVSDGIETCNPDPCAAARVLAQAGMDFTAHVVGFDVSGDAEALMQMRCIAEETGGRFLTAANASELQSALEAIVIVEPELPERVQLTLTARWDAEDGPIIDTPVTFDISGPEVSQTLESNPATTQLTPESYTVTAYNMVTEVESTKQIALPPEVSRDVVFVFETPTPTATLTTPASAPAGSTIEVGWEGPNENYDNIEITPIGGRYLDFEYTREGNPVEIVLPAQPGTYEIHYRLHDSDRIATNLIEVTPINWSVKGPAEVMAGASFEVAWEGANAQGDNIEIAHIGQRYINFEYTREGNPVTLDAPLEAGEYELRYRFRDQETLAQSLIRVVPPVAQLTAPNTALAGSTLEVAFQGPNQQRDAVQLIGPNGETIRTEATRWANPARFTLPETAGRYEVRYMLHDQVEVTSQTIEVTAPK